MKNAINFFSKTKMASAKTVFSTAASVLATAMVFRSVLQDFLPYEAQRIFSSGIRRLLKRFSPQMTMVIDEFDGLSNNQIFEAADTYLGSKVYSSKRLRVSRPPNERKFNINVERNQEVVDVFRGVKFRWLLLCTKTDSRSMYNPRDLNSTIRSEIRSFELSFHKKHMDMVLNSYFPYILKESVSLRQEKKTLKLFTVDFEKMFGKMTDAWSSISLDHPATFDTIAMDSELKRTILEDLERFVRRRDYYKKVGKAWKRGYLLYGPPGTGKSSLIAAIANYLNFDIYDLELTELRCNSELRRLLLSTANRSILVVEDIDCTIQLQDRLAETQAMNPRSFQFERQVTLSGLLNFMDGLWSSCGDERIIIFTTNHKNKLDPALLRPGRMDMHIHMSYCTTFGFKILACNYLGIANHYLFGDIEDLIRTTEVTPAEVAEHLLKSDEPEMALRDLLKFLEVKKEEARVKKEKEELEEEEEEEEEEEDDEEEEEEEEEAKPKKELELQQGVMMMTDRIPQLRLFQ